MKLKLNGEKPQTAHHMKYLGSTIDNVTEL